MGDVVLKAINTVNRRLKVGEPVNEGDDLSPHKLEDLKSGGFVGSGLPEPAPAAPRAKNYFDSPVPKDEA